MIPRLPRLYPAANFTQTGSTRIFCPDLNSGEKKWQKIYVEDTPAVFAGNGFCRMSDKKDDRKHAAQTAKKNSIEDNVQQIGTRRTKPISKATIWARSLKKLQPQKQFRILLKRPCRHRLNLSCQWKSLQLNMG